jgi:hypothetical protein
MGQFEEDARSFAARKQAEVAEARQLAALSLMCGVELSSALDAPPHVREALIRKLEHVIERERLRGMRRHWSYDLNRHIALKQVLDRLRSLAGIEVRRGTRMPRQGNRERTNGAARRRRRLQEN